MGSSRARSRLAAAITVTAAAGLLSPAGAGAATKTVEVGPFGRAATNSFEAASGDADAFFRKVTTIHVGDRVRWRFNGFHTTTFVPRGGTPPALGVPDPAHPISGVNDAAGAPFWFNGQPRLLVNPEAALPQGGRTFDPAELENSGLPPSEGRPKPYTLTFKQKGTFRYLCTVHPKMRGTVRVLAKTRRIPSAGQDRREAKREQTAVLKRVQSLTSGLGTTDVPDTLQAGNDGRGGATIFKFFPKDGTVKVGDTVTLRMSPRSAELHTFSFGPTNGRDAYLDQIPIIGPQPPDNALGFDPRAAYPSENPALGVPTFTGANHGNGFFNTGLLDQDASTPQIPSSAKVTFTTAGTYTFICLVHPFMRDTVTVAP